MAETPDGGVIAVTDDALFGGRLVLRQPAKGHRAGTDAVLLAASVGRDFAGLAYDAGAGVGQAGLGLALACPSARVGLIENEPSTLSWAIHNIATNNLSDRVSAHACDLLSGGARRAAGLDARAALVVTNPPFHQAGTVRASPDARRRAAHVEGSGGLMGWIAACLALLEPRGTLILIQKTETLPGVLEALKTGTGAITILPVHTTPKSAAKRVLVRAVKQSRAPLTIAPSLILRDGETWTPLAEQINRLETSLDW